MEQENQIYLLMMEALDGELSEAGLEALQADLRARPRLAYEWRVLLSIDHLFRQTPAMLPPPGFMQRTLGRLPDRRYRLWLVGALYLLLLLGGILPLGLIIWLVAVAGPALQQPAVWRGLGQTGGVLWNLAGTVLNAAWQLLLAFGQGVSRQPALWGWLLVMAGIVLLWGGVYGRLRRPPATARL